MLSEFLKKLLKTEKRENHEKSTAQNQQENFSIIDKMSESVLEKRLNDGTKWTSHNIKNVSESNNKPQLCPTSKSSEKFTIKHLNLIIFLTYLTIFLSTCSLFIYFNNVIQNHLLNHTTNFSKKSFSSNKIKSDFTKLEIEKIVENYLIEHRKLMELFYNNNDNENNNNHIFIRNNDESVYR